MLSSALINRSVYKFSLIKNISAGQKCLSLRLKKKIVCAPIFFLQRVALIGQNISSIETIQALYDQITYFIFTIKLHNLFLRSNYIFILFLRSNYILLFFLSFALNTHLTNMDLRCQQQITFLLLVLETFTANKKHQETQKKIIDTYYLLTYTHMITNTTIPIALSLPNIRVQYQ